MTRKVSPARLSSAVVDSLGKFAMDGQLTTPGTHDADITGVRSVSKLVHSTLPKFTQLYD